MGELRDARPLVITDDEDVLDDLLRIAAAAGVDVVHARAVESRLAWRAASVILLDARQVRGAVLAGMPRRPGVIVVAADEPDGSVWENCVLLGVERTVLVPQSEDILVAVLADSADTGPGGGRIVAFVGARGGAGASVLAAAVALAGLRAGLGVLLADCDRWGCGQDLILGLEADPGLRWTDLSAGSGRVAAAALHEALPSLSPNRRRSSGAVRGAGPGVLSVLSPDRDHVDGGPSPDALAAVLNSSRRAGELAVIDLPRAPDQVADQALTEADLVVVVSTADLASCYAAGRLIDRLADTGTELGLVVRGPSPGGMGADDVADALDLPLIAQMRPQPHLARDIELGRTPGLDARSPLGKAASTVLAAALRPGFAR